MSPSVLEESIRDFLRRDGRITLAYLFGSRARGTSGPLSDFDVAVLLTPEASRERASGELVDGLVRLLKSERVDLILLDRAPIPLRYQIVRDGKLLFSDDEKARERLVTETVMRYLDFQPIRDRAFRVARAAVLEGS
jgi:hypothetical protein